MTSDLIRNLPILPATHLIEALLDQILEDDQNTIITVKQDTIPNASDSGQGAISYQPTYDPAIAYILEFCTILVLRDGELMQNMGRVVSSAILGLLRDPAKWHPITLSRATYYALSILKQSYVRSTHSPFQHRRAYVQHRILILSKCILCSILLQTYLNALLVKHLISSRAVLLFAQISLAHYGMK